MLNVAPKGSSKGVLSHAKGIPLGKGCLVQRTPLERYGPLGNVE